MKIQIANLVTQPLEIGFFSIVEEERFRTLAMGLSSDDR
jgi:hypothetical protein